MKASNDFLMKGARCVVQERTSLEDGLPYTGTIIGFGDEKSDKQVVYVWNDTQNCVSWTHSNCVYVSNESVYDLLNDIEALVAKYNRRLSLANLKFVQARRILDKYLRTEDAYLKGNATVKHLSKMANTQEECTKWCAECEVLQRKMSVLYEVANELNTFIDETDEE